MSAPRRPRPRLRRSSVMRPADGVRRWSPGTGPPWRSGRKWILTGAHTRTNRSSGA
ncbi:hypothetical protein ACFFX0_22045 [Citricoccus parietis]|uniref:Uncharacterized protein n=1 Tax=Citricoccus parietis TaxID=592307 RepID=A0ABV5G474_9MICC